MKFEIFHSNHKQSCLYTKSFVDKQGGAWHDEIFMWEILLKVIIDWCVVVVGYTWCIENRSLLTVK